MQVGQSSLAGVLLLLAGYLGAGQLMAGQALPKTEYEHRALYLYNFAKFTQWPKESFPDEKSPFVLGILGRDPFLGDIDIIKGKTVKNRKLVVQYFSKLEEVKDCHLLFISSSETSRLAEILAALGKQSILTITEVSEWNRGHGIINLVVEKDFLAFEIDRAQAEKAGLKLDSQLLRLARNNKNLKEGSP